MGCNISLIHALAPLEIEYIFGGRGLVFFLPKRLFLAILAHFCYFAHPRFVLLVTIRLSTTSRFSQLFPYS